MAETGCLKDGHFQNLEVDGHITLKQVHDSSTLNGGLHGSSSSGTVSTSQTISLLNTDSGKVLYHEFDYTNGQTVTIQLPDNCNIGFTFRICLTEIPTGNGTMSIQANTTGSSQKFSGGSIMIAGDDSEDVNSAIFANVTAGNVSTDTTFEITGSTPKCVFGVGFIDIECIATNEILLTGFGIKLGTGNPSTSTLGGNIKFGT